MKTRIAIATSLIVLTAYGFCQAPGNNLPIGLKNYEIYDSTKSKRIPKVIKWKRSMKAESLKRLKRLESLNILNGKEI